jgi:uncharacterized protein YbjT (DUF2867 family)
MNNRGTVEKTILVTGATGYIASRLIPRLLEAGYRVRCLARRPERLRHRLWFPRVEVVAGDVTRPETLPAAMQDISAAYYLIHNMSAGHGYARLDLESARNFSQAAKNAGVEHIIYLGGLADEREKLALHLRSRLESGEALRESSVPITEFRAGIIVGPGSVSFEMIRFIAEQFPIMVGPGWLRHKSQPIATENVLDYLLAALTTPACRGKIIELGGHETLTYIDVMRAYARLRGLNRSALLLPFVPAWFMAFFIDLLTPVERSYALPLVEGLQNDSLVLDRAPHSLFPAIELLDYPEAVRRSLADLHPDTVERIWLDLERDSAQMRHEGFLVAYRRAVLPVSATEALRKAAETIGEQHWSISYQPETAREGLLRLKADSKIPGEYWLEWEATPHTDGCLLEQTVFFAPKGLPGFLFWNLLKPLHRSIFKKLTRP